MTSPFFRFEEVKREHKSIKLASCEIPLKNLVRDVGLIVCLCYRLCLVNTVLDVFLVYTCVRLLEYGLSMNVNAYSRFVLSNFS